MPDVAYDTRRCSLQVSELSLSMYVNQLVAMHKQREQQEEVGGATEPEVSEERHAQIKRLTTTKEPLESAHAQYYDQVRFDVRAHSLYSAATRDDERRQSCR